MPTFEYRCDKCRITQEKFQYEEKVPKCIYCGEDTFRLKSVSDKKEDNE